jgi:hypothetical protein
LIRAGGKLEAAIGAPSLAELHFGVLVARDSRRRQMSQVCP